jgi:hypothetical protein
MNRAQPIHGAPSLAVMPHIIAAAINGRSPDRSCSSLSLAGSLCAIHPAPHTARILPINDNVVSTSVTIAAVIGCWQLSLKAARYFHICESSQKGADEKSHLHQDGQTTFNPHQLNAYDRGRIPEGHGSGTSSGSLLHMPICLVCISE